MSFPRRTVDLTAARKAFVERDARPSYVDLATEFSLPATTITNAGADEAWPALRARYLEAQLQAADASSTLLSIVRADRTVTTAFLSLALVTLSGLQETVEEMRASDRAPASKASVYNTCGFAAKNLADALKTVGIIGAGKLLADDAKNDNGRWNEGLLQQINVTVHNLTSQAAAGGTPGPAAPDAVPSAEPDIEAPGV